MLCVLRTEHNQLLQAKAMLMCKGCGCHPVQPCSRKPTKVVPTGKLLDPEAALGDIPDAVGIVSTTVQSERLSTTEGSQGI